MEQLDIFTETFYSLLKNYKEGKSSWQPSLSSFFDLIFENSDLLRRSVEQSVYKPGKYWESLPFDGEEFFHQLKELMIARKKVLKIENSCENSAVIKKSYPEKRPEKIDLRNLEGKNYVTPIKNQGFYTGCAVFGIIAAIESSARIVMDIPQNSSKQMMLPDLSEQHLIFFAQKQDNLKDILPDFIDLTKIDRKIFDILEYCKYPGIVPETLYPYSPFNLNERPPNKDLPENFKDYTTRISGYTIYTDPEKMKMHLLTKGALISPMFTIVDFYFYKRGIFDSFYNQKVGNHCICCIGFDDKNEAWICKNSWGNKWGEDGYFKIKYGRHNVDSLMIGIDGFSRIHKEPV